ncbi:MAG: hypothetical protein HC810_02900 [Acaryochloridaceae cyanobacterium RL_2_7]|nr:hypothetical protein [Acaryochloridaceae cyanobacterium RL_2_7]
MLLGIYFLGQNIYFTTDVYPYWWRGVSADASILSLTAGVISLFYFPRREKIVGWFLLGLGIILIFASSRAILSPTSLWQFCLSLGCFTGGFQLMSRGKLNL